MRRILILFSLALSACSANNGFTDAFVELSEDNPHYFCLSNGEAYIPIGCNIAAINSVDHIHHYIKMLAQNEANYGRLWLNSALFEPETEYNVLNERNISHLALLLDLAKQHNIKIKICIESFRHIVPGKNRWDTKASYHTANGGPFEDIGDYITSQRGREEYLRRLQIVKDRIGNHPAVFGWELWNEMNAVNYPFIEEWNDYMLAEVKAMFPHHLVMQSLGSLDRESSFPIYEYIAKHKDNDVMQVHRYLDEGAELPICSAPMDSLCADAVRVLLAYNEDKPALLAEGGAVRPNHAGPSTLYPIDKKGILLHDVLFTPFFCGAAGPGHIWHWDHYVDANNLWYHFKRFANAIKDINPIVEDFLPKRARIDHLNAYILQGKKHALIWLRDARNNWQSELLQHIEPEWISNQQLSLSSITVGKKVRKISAYDPWTDICTEIKTQELIKLPPFSRSLVLRLTY